MRALLGALLVVALAGCAKADGAPGRPSLEVVAVGDTAKLFISWTAASSKATGAQLTVTVTQTNGTWASLPTASPVSATGTATVITTSTAADSATFQACMKATSGTVVSPAQGCSATRQWKRVLPPPVVNIDSLQALIVGPGTMTLTVGQSGQFCGYYKFASGHVAMRTQDRLGCQADYGTRFTVFEKAVTITEQVWADGRCQKWISSRPTVASVTTEAGCTGLGWLWMGIPLEVLRT